nr:MAG TPA: hypothetical protein [Caudoviricetes sp.]
MVRMAVWLTRMATIGPATRTGMVGLGFLALLRCATGSISKGIRFWHLILKLRYQIRSFDKIAQDCNRKGVAPWVLRVASSNEAHPAFKDRP